MRLREPERERNRVRANVDLTPLIDVVFQLLIFFMLSATFIAQTSIDIEMPEAKGAASIEHKDLAVTLVYGEGGPGGGGPIFIDDEEMTTMGEFSRRLSEEVQRRPDLRLLIRPDARVPTGRLVEVFGHIRNEGIEEYYIAAQPAPRENE